MKWYENVDMLKEILENISKELEEVEYGSRVWYLLTDESNIIKNHLELIKENQVLREKVNHFKNVKNRMRRNCRFYKKENTKLKSVILQSIELLSIDGKGTKQQVIKLLKEVLENES